ncbi:MAG TPA: M23 family metallopeptidase [Myxococcales bacterium]|nr:M23 family metallopeptidase [Myxococcales bacterium]
MRRASWLWLLLLAACHPRQSTVPPFPLGVGEPHEEPDLVGVFHVVKPGQTLWRIARTYGVDPRELARLNDIRDPAELRVGQALYVPGATRLLDVPVVPGVPAMPGPEPTARHARFAWPVQGVLVSRFGRRGGEHHDGIDIAAPEGTPIAAAAAGRVIFAGVERGYGNLAIVDHGGGEATVYAHCEKVLVSVGDAVKAGQIIARVGRTGRATGPHLHFEVREHAQPRNPLLFLPEAASARGTWIAQ